MYGLPQGVYTLSKGHMDPVLGHHHLPHSKCLRLKARVRSSRLDSDVLFKKQVLPLEGHSDAAYDRR